MRQIIKAGVDANHRDRDDCTAMWTLCLRSNEAGHYRMLADAGCECNYLPKDEADIISRYVKCCEKKEREVNDEVIKVFLEFGMTPEAVGCEPAKDHAIRVSGKMKPQYEIYKIEDGSVGCYVR